MPAQPDLTTRTMIAAILAWVVPGAGHWWAGRRGLAIVYFLAITLPFWFGVLVGGVKTSIDPRGNPWLFLAELGVGGYTLIGYAWSSMIGPIAPDRIPEFVSFYPASDVAQIYLSTAGLLNVLAVLDAITRAQTGGLPVFYHESAAEQPTEKPA